MIGEGGFVEGLLDSENAGKVFFFFQTIIPSLITGAWSLDSSLDLAIFVLENCTHRSFSVVEFNNSVLRLL